jgi:hypothetical protein
MVNPITILGGKGITLKSNDTTERKITHTAGAAMFDLSESGTKLILDGYITLQGPGPASDNGDFALVKVSGSAALEMKGHAVIRGGNSTAPGGGVAVTGGGQFTMQGGTVNGNTAKGGGGVFTIGEFTKTGNAVIYGDTDNIHTPGSTENAATDGDGHAVYWQRQDGSYKRRDSTLGPGVNISTNNPVTNWDN